MQTILQWTTEVDEIVDVLKVNNHRITVKSKIRKSLRFCSNTGPGWPVILFLQQLARAQQPPHLLLVLLLLAVPSEIEWREHSEIFVFPSGNPKVKRSDGLWWQWFCLPRLESLCNCICMHWLALRCLIGLFYPYLMILRLKSKATQLCWLTSNATNGETCSGSFDDLAMPLQLLVPQSLPSNPVRVWLSMTVLRCFNRSWICKTHRSFAVKNVANILGLFHCHSLSNSNACRVWPAKPRSQQLGRSQPRLLAVPAKTTQTFIFFQLCCVFLGCLGPIH